MSASRRRTHEEMVEVLDRATSSLQQNRTNKRVRLSTAEPSDVDSVLDDAISDVSGTDYFHETQAGGAHQSIREAYEFARDTQANGFDEEDDAEFERHTQAAMRKRRKRGPVVHPETQSGIIESITCINFMCHTKLFVQLGPLINFVIGHNGSGKSAILTALTLCLGGKATSTNRGQNLKSFIKEGQDFANLIVKIKNQEDGAYRRDVYGDSIIVERWISLQGSGFKIKTGSGKLVSTKKSELEAITDHYAMQLDNPVNVLNQDAAREFLNSSTAADKYKFFVRGTCLEKLDRDYLLVTDTLDITDRHKERLAEDVRIAKAKEEEARRKADMSKNIKSLQEKYAELGWQSAWAQVEGEEKQLEATKRAEDEGLEHINIRQQEFDDASQAYEHENGNKVRAETLKNETEQQKKYAEERHAPIKQRANELATQVQNSLAEGRSIYGDKKAAEDRLQKVEEELQKEYDRLEAANGDTHAAKIEAINEAKADVDRLQQERDIHEADVVPAAVDAKNAADKAVNDAEEPLRQQKEAFETANSRLSSLEQNTRNEDAGYLPNLQQVLKAISAERRWQQKPVGPIGRHVSIKKPEWSPIIETVFGSTLSGFGVTCKADQTKLLEILRKFKGWERTPIIITTSTPLRRLDLEPAPELDTILRILEIDNDLARNILIMNHMAESTVLMRNRRDLENFMIPGDGSAAKKNVKAGIAFHAKGVLDDGWRLSYGRGSTQKSDTVKRYVHRPRMRTDTSAQINMQREIVEEARRSLKAAEDNYRELQSTVTKVSQAHTRAMRRTTDLRRAITNAQANIDILEQQLEEATSTSSNLDSLKVEQEEKKAALDDLIEQHTLWEENRKALDAKKTAHQPEVLECIREMATFTTDLQNLERKILKAANKREKALRAKNQAEERLKQAKQSLEQLTLERERQERTVAEFVEGATQISARVPISPGDTVASIDMKRARLKAEIEDFKKQMGGDAHELEIAHLAARTDLRESQARLKETCDLWITLSRSLNRRSRAWTNFRSHISGSARMSFVELLAERGFTGRMLLDHKRKGLELRVQPEVRLDAKGRPRDEARQTKTLSGGEKSFSTICMLLALWEAMGSPIRCLDEFDVFMDSVNRDISMRMMIGAARQSAGRQYILITPQAMGNVEMGPDVKVIRLNDPERGQTVLDFRPA